MIAKYNGICSVTGRRIVAGQTEIVRTPDGKWKIAETKEAYLQRCGLVGEVRNGDVQEIVKERLSVPRGASCVFAWSDVDQDAYGDEILVHYVSFADDDGEPVGRFWNMGSAREAEDWADSLGKKSGLPVEVDTIRQ